MKNDDKASISLKKIICISILFVFIMTAAVVAGNVKLNNVKIILASGYEMNVLTSKTKIADILDDNHIILLEDEKVSPDLESELSDNNTIKISKITDEEIEAPEVIETSETITMEEVLKNYDTIIEKIVVEKVKIPFETVTKNKASGSGSKQNQIIQYGVNGIKEVTYKVKYQNDLINMKYLYMHLWLQNYILLKADKMTMSASLELRVPILDRVVFDTASKLPREYKIVGKDTTKYALRKAAAKIVPKEWAQREKKGFMVPFKYWLKEEKWYNKVKETFESEYAAKFFDTDKIVKLLNDYYEGKAMTHRKVYTIYCFLIWYRQYFVEG